MINSPTDFLKVLLLSIGFLTAGQLLAGPTVNMQEGEKENLSLPFQSPESSASVPGQTSSSAEQDDFDLIPFVADRMFQHSNSQYPTCPSSTFYTPPIESTSLLAKAKSPWPLRAEDTLRRLNLAPLEWW